MLQQPSSSNLSSSSSSAPKSTKVVHVIMIAYYMSGDRYTLASALALSPETQVVVVGPKTDSGALFGYFEEKVGKDRTLKLETETRAETEEILKLSKTPKNNVAKLAEIAQKLKLDNVTVHFHPPSFATIMVANEYSNHRNGGARNELVKFWHMEKSEARFSEFLQILGFDFNKKYAFLWCKKGSIKDEKAHHYTDQTSWALLAAAINRSNDMIAVFTGEDIGLSSKPSMIRFWVTWQSMYNEAMSLGQQLALWTFIAKKLGRNCCAIGMRSGMLEVPALLGIRTLYLEEVENDQRTRMAKWLGKVDTWFRGVMFRPLGTMQNVYWAERMVKYDSYPKVRAKLNKTPTQMKSEVTSQTRLLVCAALRHVRRHDMNAYNAARELVLEYLGYDVALDDAGALAIQAAVMTIASWALGTPSSHLGGEALADEMIKELIPLAIEGGRKQESSRPIYKPSAAEVDRLRKLKAEAELKQASSTQPPGDPAAQMMKRVSHMPPPTKFGPRR